MNEDNEVDLFSILNESDYICDENTGEFIITVPKVQSESLITVGIPCKISSNCQTIIKSKAFKVTSDILHLKSLNFEASVIVTNTQDFSISNCTIRGDDRIVASLIISECETSTINNVTITDSTDMQGLYIINSIVNADKLSIHNLTGSLIKIEKESFLTLTNSNLHHSENYAISAIDHSSIEISNCHFSDTINSLIYSENSYLSIKNSFFSYSSSDGIFITDTNDFVIENNTFSSIKKTAIYIDENSCGTIEGNTINDCQNNGIVSKESNDILIKSNTINHTIYPSIWIGHKSAASIQSNKITNCESNGIAIRGAQHAEIEGSEISEMKMNGISVSNASSCIIHNNKISNCLNAAIASFNDASVKAEKNVISNSGKFAFSAFTCGTINASNNEVDSVKEAMTSLILKGGGDFIDNKVQNCPKQNECETTSFYFFKGNGNFPSVTNDKKRISDKSVVLDELLASESSLCLNCHKNDRCCYLMNCGHKVFCKDCAEDAMKNKKECPLCLNSVDNYSFGAGENDDGLCGICFEKKADCIIIPCGHLGACYSCLYGWFKNKKTCPFCRKDVSLFQQISDY